MADILDVVDDESAMSFAEVYQMVVEHGDIILVIGKADMEPLRKGLAAIKYKSNDKLRKAGIPADERTLEYQILAPTEAVIQDDPLGEKISLQIFLKAKSGVKVHRIIFTDKEV